MSTNNVGVGRSKRGTAKTGRPREEVSECLQLCLSEGVAEDFIGGPGTAHFAEQGQLSSDSRVLSRARLQGRVRGLLAQFDNPLLPAVVLEQAEAALLNLSTSLYSEEMYYRGRELARERYEARLARRVRSLGGFS